MKNKNSIKFEYFLYEYSAGLPLLTTRRIKTTLSNLVSGWLDGPRKMEGGPRERGTGGTNLWVAPPLVK